MQKFLAPLLTALIDSSRLPSQCVSVGRRNFSGRGKCRSNDELPQAKGDQKQLTDIQEEEKHSQSDKKETHRPDHFPSNALTESEIDHEDRKSKNDNTDPP